MFKYWICIFITLIYISDVKSDADHENEIQQYLKSEDCPRQHNYNLENVLSVYDKCIVRAIANLWDAYDDNDNGQSLVKLICQQGDITQCIQQADGKLSSCYLESKKSEAFGRALESTNAAIQSLCSDDHAEIKSFASDIAQRCVDTQIPIINKQCNNDVKNINDLWFQKPFTTDEYCRYRGQWGSCVLNYLDDCEDKTAYFVVQRTLKSALFHSPCYHTTQRLYPHIFSHSSNALASYFFVLISIVFTFLAQLFA